jgi:ComF family protein
MLKATKNRLLDLIFPPLCLTCEKHLAKEQDDGPVCTTCLASPARYQKLFCPICLNTLRSADDTCHPHALYSLVPATSYDNPIIKKMVWQLKYEGWQSLAMPLAHLLVKAAKDNNLKLDNAIVVPLPLHSSKKRKRGFNQSELMADIVKGQLHLVWSPDNLERVKNTASQAAQPDWGAREKNVEDAFFINNPEQFLKKNVILIDDIFTSGTTLKEAARVLKLAGANKITALVIARAR